MIGLILAGGQGRRLGSLDKALLDIGGQTLLSRTVATLKPQCETLVLNANGDPKRFEGFGLPVVADDVTDFAGPMAGIVAGLDHVAARYPDEAFVVTAPADVPFLPHDLVWRLEERRAATGADIVCAASGGREHPVVALWSVALRTDLRHALRVAGRRRMHDIVSAYRTAVVDWPVEGGDPFFNVNTPDDLASARRLAERRASSP